MTSQHETQTGRQVGVVIAVPEPYASELRRLRESFGDPLAAVVPAHITLVTSTAAPNAEWDSVLEHVRTAAARTRPFEIVLEGSETFRPISPVVYLALQKGFAEVVDLQRRVQSGPLERELDFPFHPHVTVAHDVGDDAMDLAQGALHSYAAQFTADSMGLYEHQDDGGWRFIERLTFDGQPPGGEGDQHRDDRASRGDAASGTP